MRQGLSGLDVVLQNLNAEIMKIKSRGLQGLIEAGVLIRYEGQKQTPVDKGNLINSWYGPTPYKVLNKDVVELGLTASYAVYVHEMVDAHFQKSGAKAKFLEDPLKALAGKCLFIIGKKAEIP